MRRIALLLAIALAVASCGEEGLLDNVGDRTQRVVVGTTTTTEAPDGSNRPGADGAVVSSAALAWYNDGIEGEALGLPAYTIDQVWKRGGESTRFVQSSRAEIAVALPGIQFPAELPGIVATVTSQLVYLEDIATLDAGTSAAFGLWEAEPYTSEEARVGVLRVGEERGDLDLGEMQTEVVTAGLSLIWTDGRYRYELFCRASLGEEPCRDMAASAAPLRDLLGT